MSEPSWACTEPHCDGAELIMLKTMICSFTDGEKVAASLSQASLTVNNAFFHLDLSPCSFV